MDVLRWFKTTFQDPKIVVKIQNFFGVSYDEQYPRPLPLLPMNEHHDEDGKPSRRKSIISSEDGAEDSCSPLNNNTRCEKSPCKMENGSVGQHNTAYTIRNKFWYYLFMCGTYLGDEIGYAIFLPFWFWNVDGSVTRKLVLVWTLIMYVGQSIKDIVKWPRPPSPPVIRLQKKWALEYGMPSTHAMVGVAFPTTVLYFSSSRHEFPIVYGIIVAALWCTLISLSRLYLGMHSLLDVMVGLLLSSVLLVPLLPIMNYIDPKLMKWDWSPAILVVISVTLLVIYPHSSPRTPTIGDTSIILGTCVGIQTGWWFNFHFGIVVERSESQYIDSVSDMDLWSTLGCGALRMVVGLFCIFISMVAFDIFFKITDKILEKLKYPVKDPSDSKRRIQFLNLLYKYLTFCISSFHVVCSIPVLFKVLKIERPSYYRE